MQLPPIIDAEVFRMINRLSEVKKVLLFLFMLFISISVFAGSFWEGSITIANYGDLPDKGFYGASNAFPLNTAVVVTNPENGTTVEVTIVKRLDNANAFIALSSDAGKRIGLKRGEMVSGTMSVQTPESSTHSSDLVNNRDPEVNHNNEGKDSELSLIQDYINTELNGVQEKQEQAVSQSKAASAESTPLETANNTELTKTEEQTGGTKTAVTDKTSEPPKVVTDLPMVFIVKTGIPAGSTVKSIPLPDPLLQKERIMEREKPSVYSSFTSAPQNIDKKTFRANSYPVLTEAKEDTPQVLSMIAHPEEGHFTAPEISLPCITVKQEQETETKPELFTAKIPEGAKESPLPVSLAVPKLIPEGKPVETVVTALPVPAKAEEKPSVTKAPLPVVEPSKKVELVLEAAGPKPPPPSSGEPGTKMGLSNTKSETPVPAVAVQAVNRPAEEITAPGSGYTMTTKLKKGSYYLQLGAYDEEFSAKDLAVTLAVKYPVTVLVRGKPEKSSYKVMVGPLNQDEGGSLLFNFRSKGFTGAFLRKGVH